ncbi:DMT family transporter [Streptosporangiaceae bacterium NEAU-GS5]|nr:DMT family transporter [Streptosporangiaceae bacterium NEAU-GS5]
MSLKTIAQAAAAMFCVGTLAAVSAVIGDYPLYGGQAMRYGVAAVILVVVAHARGLRLMRISGRETVLLVALALTGLVLFNVCVIEGTRESGAPLVGTVVGTLPLALAVLAPLTSGRQTISPRVLAAAIVVVTGATLVTGFGTGTLTGLLWSIGALACEVCFSLLALPLLPKLGAIRVSAYSAAIAVPLLIVAGLIADGSGLIRPPTLAEALSLAYLAVIITSIAFLLWYSAMPRLGPDRAGLFAGLVPVGAIVTTMALGRGVPSAADFAGTAVVIAGILIGLKPVRGASPASADARYRPDA